VFQSARQSENFDARVIAEIVMVSIGIALLGCALAADHRWLDRHFLPAYFVTRQVYVVALSLARAVVTALGAALVLVLRPRFGRLVVRLQASAFFADAARLSLAVALALGTSELVLRHTFRHSSEEQAPSEEPVRRRDPRLGWSFVPARTGHDTVDGRMIEYAFDSSGYRVRRASEPVDHERPTVIFTGESIMVGEGLTWDETVPAQVEAILGTQSANLAVSGFASDQAYLRLLAELPRFHQPVAVVSLFTPGLFDRNMDDDRPHLGPDLVWLPANPRWRLAMIASWLVPYRSDAEIERGVAMTRAVLRATVALARARGAAALIVMPQFIPEDPTDRVVRRRILDETELPYVWVGLDPSWRLRGNLHPDPRAARAIAISVAARLRGR
jgi:hypothetical protein